MHRRNGSTWWLPERDHGPLQTGSYTSVWHGYSVVVEAVKGGLVHFIGWSHRDAVYRGYTLPIKRFRKLYRRSKS
jgi:hypothetical protein